jgi:thiamine-phosphate pyrophosphorylase
MKPLCEWKLYAITDRALSRGRSHQDVIRSAILGGADVIQLRDTRASTADVYREALVLRKLTRTMETPFIINDRVDIALAVDADGVHLGQADLPVSVARRLLGPDKIIGLSTHSLEGLRAASGDEIDYLSIGPIFPTKTKQTHTPVGTRLIQEGKELIQVPIVAIGGIKENNITEVLRAGADIVAVISAVVSADDVEESARNLKRKLVSIDQG